MIAEPSNPYQVNHWPLGQILYETDDKLIGTRPSLNLRTVSIKCFIPQQAVNEYYHRGNKP